MNRILPTTDQHVIEGDMLAKMHAQARGGKTTLPVRRPSAAGLTHPKSYLTLAGYEQRTPHSIKELRARRARSRVAKRARKVNRRYRATGGLR